MARSQQHLLLVLLFYLWAICHLRLVDCCHATSKELHICLNIYLERDFPIIETILKGQQSSGFRNGRVLLEGPDLKDICDNIKELQDCYRNLLQECNSYWQLNQYTKLMKGVSATYTYLCANTTDNVRDLLLHGTCLRQAKDRIEHCSHYGVTWDFTWREIMRMQVTPIEKCPSLQLYKECFVREINYEKCGHEASVLYGRLLDLWLQTWCSAGVIDNPSRLIKVIGIIMVLYTSLYAS